MRQTVRNYVWVATIALFLSVSIRTGWAHQDHHKDPASPQDRVTSAGSPWGATYFPNVPLITEEGETVRFFDDLIQDKVVVINFIYTTCPDTCPLETAQLVRVQRILGDRVGKDVFFYSISIDPENDTPSALKAYKQKFGAQWPFLSGKNADIIKLRKKLGLYIEEIQGSSNNHNVNMIIGNQRTGRWMKRSPFVNPYVLADQIGNWLTGWKAAQHGDDYANAPQLRKISDGEKLFRTRCTSCHTIDGSEGSTMGPDLLGVTQRRDRAWLVNWLRAPDKMLAEKDPIAMKLYVRFNQVPMPNMRLSQVDVADLVRYLEKESQRVIARQNSGSGIAAPIASRDAEPSDDVVTIMNAWVREAHSDAKVNAGYMTLINAGPSDVTLVKIESPAFEKVEIHEMAMADGLMTMHKIPKLVVPSGGQAHFKPGGRHLMLMGPQRQVAAGQKVDMVLTFISGIKQTVSVKVAVKESSRSMPGLTKWLRVLGHAESPQIDQGVRHQLHRVMPTLEMLKPHQ